MATAAIFFLASTSSTVAVAAIIHLPSIATPPFLKQQEAPPSPPPDMGPFPFFLSPFGKFRWQASLNKNTTTTTTTTGSWWKQQQQIATSKEVSRREWYGHYESPKECQRSIFRVSDKWIRQYPSWMVRSKVTLGLLKTATKTTTYDSNQKDLKSSTTTTSTKTTFVCPRFFSNRVQLLQFGPVQVIRRGRKQCQWKLPITGGLLALAPPPPTKEEEEDSSSNNNSRKNKKKKDDVDLGYLLFETTSNIVQHSNKTHPYYKMGCQFQSSIGGQYSPSIAGPTPISTPRKWMYLGTQSITHAYVMWRFHNAWNKRVTTVC
eukprot:scaffold1143_cov96-Cylindrotheca_fusiformis.AAC.5